MNQVNELWGWTPQGYVMDMINIDYWYRFNDFTVAILAGIACDKTKYSIDLGSHYGMFTGLIGRLSKKVIAIDPNPVVAEFKKKYDHWWTEPQRGKTIFICSAILNTTGSETYREYVSINGADESGWNSLRDNPMQNPNLVEKNSFEVSVEKLDDLISPSYKIGFLKIDVEGVNISAVKSGWELIKRNKPVIVFETGRSPDISIVQELNELNYDVWPIGRPIGEPVHDATKTLQNLLAIHRDYDLNKRNEIINSLNEFTNFVASLIDKGFDFKKDHPKVLEWVSNFLKPRVVFDK